MEQCPSFSPPRRDIRTPDAVPGATEVWSERLDTLNNKFERLLEALSQRLKTAAEVNGAEGLVSTVVVFSFYLFLFWNGKCDHFFLEKKRWLTNHTSHFILFDKFCVIFHIIIYFITKDKVYQKEYFFFGNNTLMNINWILLYNTSGTDDKLLNHYRFSYESKVTNRSKMKNKDSDKKYMKSVNLTN